MTIDAGEDVRLGAKQGGEGRMAHPALVPSALVAMVVAGGLIRILLARQDLFADELATYWVVSTRGFTGVVKTVATTAEITPPFGFVLSWLTSRLGLRPELVRLPALIAGIACIPLVYAVGARTVGRGAGLLAAALTTLSPFMIYYSTEARGYGVLLALLLLSTLSLLNAIEDGRWPWWAAYGAFVTLCAYTHYTAVFVLAAQFLWAFMAHPRCRRSLVVATTTAALLYAPWLPSLKGDIDSPTTKILSDLSPFTVDSARLTLGHWSVGFPSAFPGTQLRDLPGTPGFMLLVGSLVMGAYGIFSMRSRLRAWFAARGGRIGLIVALALATPVGTALQSALGDNVFSTRALTASWPYLALAVAALITVGRSAVRITAAVLAVAAFAIGTTQLAVNPDFQRPKFSQLAAFARDHPTAVLVDGASFTPGPLTNFEVEGSLPGIEVLRLDAPEGDELPFAVGQALPEPTDVARRAVAAAGDGPIIVIADLPPSTLVLDLISQLPEEYQLTDRKVVRSIFDLQALVFERTRSP